MSSAASQKYRPFRPIDLPDRQWPSRVIEKAPIWVSVDLRDGNQALIRPMDVHEKLQMFTLLVRLGFTEIEVGFPSASQPEFDFIRMLIEQKLIPPDVWIQVLTQAREHLIRRTFESLVGCERAIVHLYNSTSTVQRRVVFRMSQDEIAGLAVSGTKLVKELTSKVGDTQIRYEYSPESFTGTELEFSKRICEDVMSVWEPTAEAPIVLNLPATVELATPNVYADQIEWMSRNLADRDKAIISVHTHNDRGSAVAAAELAQMAGAERVEGTLFGYGERTGNVDLVTLALNLYTQGIEPGLDLSRLDEISQTVRLCTEEPLHPRHPYSGELVFTAFSGSHQDAISKGMAEWNADPSNLWDVPYIAIDPKDIGRDYTTIIRVNSQSGKGGAAYLLREYAGFEIPRQMQPEFGQVIQRVAERTGSELSPAMIAQEFDREYLEPYAPYELVMHEEQQLDGEVACHAVISVDLHERPVGGKGNGPIDAFVSALQNLVSFDLISFQEHSMGSGADCKAAAYVYCQKDGRGAWGAAVDENATTATMMAILVSVNKLSATTE